MSEELIMKLSKSRQAEKALKIEDLQKRFKFDLELGEIWNLRSGMRADVLHHFKGQSSSNTRYKQVQFWFVLPNEHEKSNIKIAAHRMIWAVVHGRWPADGMDIDHINSNTLDNRPCNLEEVTEIENIRRGRQR